MPKGTSFMDVFVNPAKLITIPKEVYSLIAKGKPPIQVWRDYKKISMLTAAKRLRVPITIYSQMERMAPMKHPPKLLNLIAKAIGVDKEELLLHYKDWIK